MTTTRNIGVFEASRQKTNLWLKDIATQMRTNDRHKAYAALRAVLHSLRDCLPMEEVAKFSAQMPLLITGVFFDGWKPRRKPVRMRRDEFYASIREQLRGQPNIDAGLAARAVFRVLEDHLSLGETEGLRRVLPTEIRAVWKDTIEQGEEGAETERTPSVKAQAGVPAWP
jgi:uncharacterized protein (DUF2267 family)